MNREDFIEKTRQRYKFVNFSRGDSESPYDLISGYAQRDPVMKKIIA